MVPTRAHSPHVPLTESEIVADAIRCIDAGASIVHLHARDRDAAPSSDPALMRPLIAGIRSQRDKVVLTVTTSGRRVSDPQARSAVLRELTGELRPDMASLTLSSLNFSTQASVNAPDTILHLAEAMANAGVKPELEVFDLGMVNMAHVLIDKGLIQPPYYFNLLVGNVATAQLQLLQIAALVQALPAQSIWALAGIGRFQAGANALGVVCADGVRTGLEDNLWADAGRTRLATNLELVQRVTGIAAAMGRGVASATETRARLGLAA